MQEIWHCKPDYSKENVYRIWDQDDNYHDDTTPEAMDRRAALVQAAPALVEALELAHHCLYGATQDSYYDAAKATIRKALEQAKGGA